MEMMHSFVNGVTPVLVVYLLSCNLHRDYKGHKLRQIKLQLGKASNGKSKYRDFGQKRKILRHF